MTRIITMSLRDTGREMERGRGKKKKKKSHFPQEWNDKVPADGSLLQLNVTSLQVSPSWQCCLTHLWVRKERKKETWPTQQLQLIGPDTKEREHSQQSLRSCNGARTFLLNLNDGMINGRASVLSAPSVWVCTRGRGGGVYHWMSQVISLFDGHSKRASC